MNGTLRNPFRPGAGHMPPYLAGRQDEETEFKKLLSQTEITDNLILTGLRGVGKTVLLETFKPIAQQEGWLWVGTDLSESSCVDEERIAKRMLADLSIASSAITFQRRDAAKIGFVPETETIERKMNHATLQSIYDHTPGLVTDKLIAVLKIIAERIPETGKRGIVFAYDEAQTMSDHAKKEEYPLSVMLQVFQSVQRQGLPYLLVLTGLPTLFSKLVEARTYAERMFHTLFLDKLAEAASKEAIQKPLEQTNLPLSDESVELIVKTSGGYPYFIQFICREVYDIFIQKVEDGAAPWVPMEDIIAKLDADFFAGRWQRLTDRQKDLLEVIAQLPTSNKEFAVQEIAELSKEKLKKRFTPSHVNQMLSSLCDKGIIFKNRHGKYSFAVPLLDKFILRQIGGG